MGKWYARPMNWAGIWNKKGELVGCNTLFESDSEIEVDKYIEAYNTKRG